MVELDKYDIQILKTARTQEAKDLWLEIINTEKHFHEGKLMSDTYFVDNKKFPLSVRLHRLILQDLNNVEPWFNIPNCNYSLTAYKRHLLNNEYITAFTIRREFITTVKFKLGSDNVQNYKKALLKQSKIDTWDAQRVLKESIAIYESCKDLKPTQALRALELIGKHALVDAFVSNKVVLEQKIDYASLLSEASQRVAIDSPKDKEVH